MLKRLLKANRMSQRDLAQKCQVTDAAVHYWVGRGVPARRAFQLAKIFDVPAEIFAPKGTFSHLPPPASE